MKLYYSPGACSLADHIALHEAGLPFEHGRVDLKTGTVGDGSDYRAINPKGYVPALTLDSGETLSENIAILDWITQQAPQLAPGGHMGRTHLLEALAYISTEVHKALRRSSRVRATRKRPRPAIRWRRGSAISPRRWSAITCSGRSSASPTATCS